MLDRQQANHKRLVIKKMNKPTENMKGCMRKTVQASVIVVACAVAFSMPTIAGQPPDDIANEIAVEFDKFQKIFKDLAEDLKGRPPYQLDEAHKVGVYDIISGFMHTSLRSNFSSAGNGRRGSIYITGYDDPHTRVGGDNPDTLYLSGLANNADGKGIYRMWGNRSNTQDQVITTFDASSGSGGGAAVNTDELVNLAGNPLQLGEDYEVFFSTHAKRKHYMSNWIEISANDLIALGRRQTSCDWAVEQPTALHIERLDRRGVQNNTLRQEDLLQALKDANAINSEQGTYWADLGETFQATIAANFIPPWIGTGGLGITNQLSLQAWFDLQADEALIITLPEPPANYHGLEIINMWGSSMDWATRTTSMNWGSECNSQAEVSDDGMYRIVISNEDPGIANWIDASGLRQGMILGRMQGLTDEQFEEYERNPVWGPTTQVVKTSDVKDILLLHGATEFDAQDRAAQIQIRQNFIRSKYHYF